MITIEEKSVNKDSPIGTPAFRRPTAACVVRNLRFTVSYSAMIFPKTLTKDKGVPDAVSRKSRNFSGDIIRFVSSKQECSVSRNFALILIFTSFTTYEKTSFTE